MRNTLELRAMAMQRLGKQVVEFTNVTEKFGDKTVLDHIDWHVGPGDRYGILGENGAGKTTLLSVLDGSLRPSSGFVKIGKTVKFAVLSQRLDELNELGKISRDRGALAPQEPHCGRRKGNHARQAARTSRLFVEALCIRVSKICRAVKSAVCSCCSFFWKNLMCSSWTSRATTSTPICLPYWRICSIHGRARSLW